MLFEGLPARCRIQTVSRRRRGAQERGEGWLDGTAGGDNFFRLRPKVMALGGAGCGRYFKRLTMPPSRERLLARRTLSEVAEQPTRSARSCHDMVIRFHSLSLALIVCNAEGGLLQAPVHHRPFMNFNNPLRHLRTVFIILFVFRTHKSLSFRDF